MAIMTLFPEAMTSMAFEDEHFSDITKSWQFRLVISESFYYPYTMSLCRD